MKIVKPLGRNLPDGLVRVSLCDRNPDVARALASHFQNIGSVAVPGLGTGVGGMALDESALQMRAAYDMILGGGWRSIQHPLQAPFVMRTQVRRP